MTHALVSSRADGAHTHIGSSHLQAVRGAGVSMWAPLKV